MSNSLSIKNARHISYGQTTHHSQYKASHYSQAYPMHPCHTNSNNSPPTLEYDAQIRPDDFTYCEICNKPKPPRAYHCKKCDRCILRRNHHCFWLGNCIGFDNEKYFVLLLIYLLALLIFMTLFLVSDLILYGDMISRDHLFLYGSGTFMSLSEICYFGHLLYYQLAFLSKNITTTEFYSTIFSHRNVFLTIFLTYIQNPFDLKDCKLNMEQVFGKLSGFWLIPSKPIDRNTDGINYPVSEDSVMGDLNNILLL